RCSDAEHGPHLQPRRPLHGHAGYGVHRVHYAVLLVLERGPATAVPDPRTVLQGAWVQGLHPCARRAHPEDRSPQFPLLARERVDHGPWALAYGGGWAR